jgi:xylulokinase
MYLLGYDIGSSSIKAAVVEVDTGNTIGVVQYPDAAMPMLAVHPGWAEQDPEMWWDGVCKATQKLLAKTNIQPSDIHGIGISYQMHGLVLTDKNDQSLRPSIIWCDSRAVEIGNAAFDAIGPEKCLQHLLNSPGNFTASKLKWVKDNEPDTFGKIHKMMLPGDYIALRLTGETITTPSGLSEGMLWDYLENDVAAIITDYYGFGHQIIPEIRPSCSEQGKVTAQAAVQTGLRAGIPVTYRAGDQPNNALSLNVLKPGEVAATGGTSGVIYGVVDHPAYDLASRVNGFLHVNHTNEDPRIGILLCINGAGIQYNWIRQHLGSTGISYQEMEQAASAIPVGADGLQVIPFGNGAERMLGNRNPGAHFGNLQFNRHGSAHFYRAALEGIAFSFVYGAEILNGMGVGIKVMRAGNDNLFQSAVFSTTIATLLNCSIDIVETTGAVGAAKAAGVAPGFYKSLEEALHNTTVLKTFIPATEKSAFEDAYSNWRKYLAVVAAV